MSIKIAVNKISYYVEYKFKRVKEYVKKYINVSSDSIYYYFFIGISNYH